MYTEPSDFLDRLIDNLSDGSREHRNFLIDGAIELSDIFMKNAFHKCSDTNIHTDIHKYMYSLYTHMYTYIHTYSHIQTYIHTYIYTIV